MKILSVIKLICALLAILLSLSLILVPVASTVISFLEIFSDVTGALDYYFNEYNFDVAIGLFLEYSFTVFFDYLGYHIDHSASLLIMSGIFSCFGTYLAFDSASALIKNSPKANKEK